MKKITLMMVGLSVFALSFGQVAKTSLNTPVKQLAVIEQPSTLISEKAGGEVFWETSFDWTDATQEQGWSLPAGWDIRDESDLGNVWKWRNDTLKGNYTNQAAPSFFVTGSNGFIAVPADEYNARDGVTTSVAMNTHITTPPIDCSAVSSVVVKFSQYFRLCCNNYNLNMLVTNDNGVHWATYDCVFGVSGNEVTTEKYRNVEINITDVAAGLPSVQIRFHITGPSHYFWMIDDLQLAEAFHYDVVLEDTWMDFDGGNDASIEHINYWPLSQMGMPGAASGIVGTYSLKGALLNRGIDDSEDTQIRMDILKNGQSYQSEITAAKTIWTLERDTQALEKIFLADDYGDYRVDFTAVFNNEDEVLANNTASMYFTVNDTLAHRADFSAESTGNTGGWSNGGNAGDMLVVNYYLYAPAEINSLTAYVGTFTAAEDPQFQYVLMRDIDGTFEEWIATDVMDMDSSLMRQWVTLPIIKDGETEFLEPGLYAACVRMWGTVEGDDNGTQGINIGRDLSTKFAGCPQYYVDGTWTNLAGNPLWMIGFNINETGGPTAADVTFNVDMNAHIANGEFHPGTDNVDVTGFTSVWMGPASMTDADGDGIYTATVAGLPVGQKIEYKYRVNGIEEAYPTTGNLHRNYTIRYWNVIDSRFNNGVTTGIGVNELMESFSVYPNPSSGSFNVNISCKANTDIAITLSNIQGQVLYRNQVSNVLNHEETISQDLARGIYFLTVNSGQEVKVQKVVVQ